MAGVIEMFGLAVSVKAEAFEPASTCGQAGLYPACPWLTCGTPSIALSSPDLPIYWPVLAYDLHFVPHPQRAQRPPERPTLGRAGT